MKNDVHPDLDDYIAQVISRLFELFEKMRPDLLVDRDGQRQVHQSAVAAECGLEQSTIGRIFGGEHTPNIASIAELAPVLNLQVTDLFQYIFSIPERSDTIQFSKGYETVNEDYELFTQAISTLPQAQMAWILNKIKIMLDAQQLLAENRDLYKLIYGDGDPE